MEGAVMSKPDPEDFLPLPHLPFHVLLALAEDAPMHGWAVIKRIEEMTEGRTCPSTGSLYLAMVRLEDRGLLEHVAPPSQDEDDRRRHYRLSSLGRRVLEAETQRLAALLSVARDAHVLPHAE
jgi:DNA-binding PadR family transcriptional regulator